MKIKRIIHRVLLVLLLSIVGLLFYYSLWLLTDGEFRDEIQNGWPLKSWTIFVDYFACCLFTTVVTIYYWHSREKAEKERDYFRLQVLENQLCPHFVFNNFSILAELIEVNPEKASKYLIDLSKVYRYTLSHLDHSIVSLQEELEFIYRYLALLKERFGDTIQVHIAEDLQNLDGFLPPAALQILIENAIKHNKHTTIFPLEIYITTDEKTICVTNLKRLKTPNESSLIGQNNLIERYKLLTKEKIVITNSNMYYRVTIPIIERK